MLFRNQIMVLKTIASLDPATFDEMARAMRSYSISKSALYVYLGRYRKRGFLTTEYHRRASSTYASYHLTVLGERIIEAWDFLKWVSPTGWPYGKKRHKGKSK